MNSQKGLTITELLIALVITIVVISASIEAYTSFKNTYNSSEEDLEATNKAALTKQIFDSAFRNIGFACPYGTRNKTFSDKTSKEMKLFSKGPVSIGTMPVTNGGSIPDTLTATGSTTEYQQGTQYLLIQRDVGYTKTTTEYKNEEDTSFDIANALSDLKSNDYVVTCSKDSFRLLWVDVVSEEVLQPKNLTENISEGDYIGRYKMMLFYIRDSGEKDENNKPIFSLYMYTTDSSSDGMPYELVRGVNNLKIQYLLANDLTDADNNVKWQDLTGSSMKIDSSVAAINIFFEIFDKKYNEVILTNVK